MKKCIALFLTCVLLLPLVTMVQAEGIDLSSLSDSELLALESAIQAEKIERGLAKSATVYSGVYVVGTDIPAGVYSIETVKGAADHLIVRDATGKQIGSYAIGTSSNRSPIGRLELLDGYTIEFDSCTLKFTVYAGGIVFN